MTWDIIGQSRRGERTTEQGEGSEEQIPYREAFQHCTELWNSLPEECPAVVPDPPPTSKKSVWEAKLEHGVVCSYYDLFMRCCIRYAQAHGGAMPDGDCFPCESDCDCTDISIGYTTQGMQVNEEQNLTVVGAVAGCTYTWGLSGGGELSAETGTAITYTAPSTNAECTNNAAITLSVDGSLCDSLHIAINVYAWSTIAYTIYGPCIKLGPGGHPCPHLTIPAGQYWIGAPYNNYKCDGTRISCSLQSSYNYIRPQDEAAGWAFCAANHTYDGTVDQRTEQMITQGCCPVVLL